MDSQKAEEQKDLSEYFKDLFRDDASFSEVISNSFISLLKKSSEEEIIEALDGVSKERVKNTLILYYGMTREVLLNLLTARIIQSLGASEFCKVFNEVVYCGKEELFELIKGKVRKGASFMDIYSDYEKLKDETLEVMIELMFPQDILAKEFSDILTRFAYLSKRLTDRNQRIDMDVLRSQIAQKLVGPVGASIKI